MGGFLKSTFSVVFVFGLKAVSHVLAILYIAFLLVDPQAKVYLVCKTWTH